MANQTGTGNTDNTISVDELLTDVLASYQKKFPVIKQLSTDFSSESARKGQSVIARILSQPGVETYNGSYSVKTDGSTSADSVASLTKDLVITLDQHKHVPVKMDYADLIATRRDLYGEMIGELSYALGNDFMKQVWQKLTASNFSNAVTRDGDATDTTKSHDLDMIHEVREKLNSQGASTQGRYGIVSSAVMTKLLSDTRIASGDYYGQLSGSNGIGQLNNIGGFEAIYEYPEATETVGGSDENIVGFFGDKSAINIAGRVPSDFNEQASRANAPAIASSSIVSDANTGLSMMGITYQEAGTFDIYTTLTHIYGLRAGAEGGKGDTSNGGVRLITA